MAHFFRPLLAASVFALVVASPALSQSQPVGRMVADYTVYLDPPTGYVFVKLPAGWKFVGRVDARDVAKAPDSVRMNLLTDDESPREDAAQGHTESRQQAAR
ncbi:MAG: hypothetical protein IPJ08_11625 [Burkholderiales bacterium]|nr:hypothetical protein [Burkholderiales bacterium]MBP6675400.1 hypothetical protein [Vitreoscilla sp.]